MRETDDLSNYLLPPLHFKLEEIHAPNPNVHPKDGTSQPLALRVVAVVVVGRRCDEEVLADKLHARRVARRDADAAQHRARAPVDAQHHALAVKGLPDVALGVDAQAVGLRGAGCVTVVHAAPAHGAGGGVVVKGKELARRRVRKVHGAQVGRPAHAVGDGEARDELPGRVWREEKQAAWGAPTRDVSVCMKKKGTTGEET